MRILLAGLAVTAFAWCASTLAQTYPSRPIRMIVGVSPGGNVDITARIVATSLGEQFGQSVIVDNRPGAGGAIGGNLVVKSVPDGYTLLAAGSGTMTTLPASTVPSKMPYDPVKDFAAISMVQSVPYVVVGSLKAPVVSSNLSELIASAKTRPGQVTMAQGGDTATILSIELLNKMAGIKLLAVPYKGGGPALTDVMGGQVDTFIGPLTGVINSIRDGRVKGLAVTSLKRSSVMPTIPTMDELGLKGFEAVNFVGVFGPVGTPQAVINVVNAAIIKAVRSPAVKEKIHDLGADPQEMTPQQFSAYVVSDVEKWEKIAQAAGFKAE